MSASPTGAHKTFFNLTLSDKRHALWFVLVMTVLVVIAGWRYAGSVFAVDNPIVIENQQPGSGGWWLSQTWANDTAKQIKGYASATSVNKGEPLTFYVTVNPAQTYNIDVYRIGWYQGLGGRLMQHIGPLNGVTQPACPMDATTGMIACNWAAVYTLNTLTTWTSGVYLAVLTNRQNFQSYITFVVRDDNRVAPLLYQQSVTTYQAYNNYPNDGATGKSLYDYNSFGAVTASGGVRAAKVSFDRPYSTWNGSGDFNQWELYFVRWLERSGYDVSYSTDIDTHANGNRLRNYRAFLSVGHDEYWSKEMRDAVETARDSGVNVGFFGANAVYWQVRFEASANLSPNRVLVSYKKATNDPVQGATTTVRFREPPVNRPEQPLIGVQFTAQTQNNAYVSYVVANTTNWVYASTGFNNGDSVPGILGYEADRQFATTPLPNSVPGTYTLLSQSPFTNTNNLSDVGNASIYQAPSGAWVFGAGSIAWSWGLDNYASHNVANARIQQTTANILNQFLSNSSPVIAAPSNLAATFVSGNTVNLAWRDNSSNEDNFVIERSSDQSSWTTLTTTQPANNTSYVDTVPVGGLYYYRVRATNSAGSGSGYSNTASVSVPQAASSGDPLPVPTGLSASATTSGRVDLTWADNATTETAYAVERSSDGNTNWSALTATLAANTVSYADTAVSPSTTYYYRVKASTPTVSSSYSNTASATTAASSANLSVYADNLTTGWVSWSWNSTVDFANTNRVYSGTRSIAYTADSGYAGLYLHTDAAVETTPYSTLNFAAQATQSGQRYAVQLYDANNQAFAAATPLANLGGDPMAGSWKPYSIPLSSLNAVGKQVKGIVIQSLASVAQPALYVDALGLSGAGSPPPPPSGGITIYADSLATGWMNWAWSSTVNFSNSAIVYSGAAAISYTANAGWAGFYLHNDTAMSTSSVSTVQFAARATQAGQVYSISLYDANNQALKSAVRLTNYGGDPPVGAWKLYTIPLADLNGAGKQIKGIVIQEGLGRAQPALYIDQLTFQ